jgi:hypothetical protein
MPAREKSNKDITQATRFGTFYVLPFTTMKTAVIIYVLSLGTVGLTLPKPDGIVLVPIDSGCWRT